MSRVADVLRTAGAPTSWKWLLLRGVVVLLVLAWAWRVMEAPMRTSELPRTGVTPAAVAGDPGQLAAALAEVGDRGCPVPAGSRLWVRVGPGGLERALVLPPVEDPSCLGDATWSRRWPALEPAIEVEFPLGD